MLISPRDQERIRQLLLTAEEGNSEPLEGESHSLKDLKEAFCGEGTCGSGKIDGTKFADLSEDEEAKVIQSLKALDPKWPELWKKTSEAHASAENPMKEKIALLKRAIKASVAASLRAAAQVLLEGALEDTPMYTYRLSGQPKAKPPGTIIKTGKDGTVYALFHHEPDSKELSKLGVKATKVGEPSGDQVWETLSHAPT